MVTRKKKSTRKGSSPAQKAARAKFLKMVRAKKSKSKKGSY
jgi:hypothetical protein